MELNELSENEIVSLAEQMINIKKFIIEKHSKYIRESSQCLLRILDIYDEYGDDKRSAEISIEFKECNERRRELAAIITALDEIKSRI